MPKTGTDREPPESEKKCVAAKFLPNAEQSNELLSALENEELRLLIFIAASLGLGVRKLPRSNGKRLTQQSGCWK
jgi:hypothetical protein